MEFILKISNHLLLTFSVLNLLLALLVYLKKDNERINGTFSLIALCSSLWVFTNAMSLSAANIDMGIFWAKVSYLSASLIATFFAYFSLIFPKELSNKLNKFSLKKGHKSFFGISSVIILIVILIPDFTVVNVELIPWNIVTGPGIYLFAFYFLALMGWSFRNLIGKYVRSEGIEKLQLKYLFLGFSLSTIFGGFFNLALPLLGNYEFVWLGPIFTFFFIGFVTYAIVKEELFDIKVILTTSLVVVLTFLLATDIFLFTENFIFQIVKGITLMMFIIFGRYLVVNVIREIERREELEELSDQLVETNIKLKKANKKLKKLDKAKSEFISIASHQLRTPLTAIKGYLSMVVEGSYGDVPEEAKGKMEDVLGSSERLISLVNDLLNVSRIESGKIEMDFENVKIIDFINQSIKELKIVAEKEGLYLQLNSEVDENQSVELDESRMRQVVLNIIDNAIKYTEEGGITINLKNQKMESGCDSVLIEISDTGEGMTQKDIENIFDSFSRGSAGDLMHTEGAGLGLYIAKKFVDMHNGSIWIESKGKGEGTSFLIELPVKQL